MICMVEQKNNQIAKDAANLGYKKIILFLNIINYRDRLH